MVCKQMLYDSFAAWGGRGGWMPQQEDQGAQVVQLEGASNSKVHEVPLDESCSQVECPGIKATFGHSIHFGK